MIDFICPVCRKNLNDLGNLCKCDNRHCFDKSKFGYVNLLQSQKSSAKRHGDDRLMVRARRDFLNAGYYGFLLDGLYEICEKFFTDNSVILDAGCGECYYSSEIKQKYGFDFVGVDISKDALEFASKRKSGIKTAVASLFDLPFADGCFDGLLNIFSPEADGEFRRVLKKDGIMIRVIPLERHLYDLKAVIYDKPYENEVPEPSVDGFELIKTVQRKARIHLRNNDDIQNLFKMTPYYYKTGKDDQQKINSLESFETQAEFEIRIYKRTD